MHTGVVKSFDERKAYGFIIDDATKEEIFVHVTGLAKGLLTPIKAGDKVEFEIEQGRKGPNAIKVMVV